MRVELLRAIHGLIFFCCIRSRTVEIMRSNGCNWCKIHVFRIGQEKQSRNKILRRCIILKLLVCPSEGCGLKVSKTHSTTILQWDMV